MKIAISGPHNSGKTTLFNKLKELYDYQYLITCPECLKTIKEQGFKINEEADNASQLAMCAIHLQNLLYHDILTDRCLFDNYVYANYLSKKSNKVTKETVDFIKDMMLRELPLYNKIYYCMPEFEMEDNKFRSTDEKFRQDIHKEFIEAYSELPFNLQHKFYFLKGSTDERFKKIVELDNENRKDSVPF